MTRTILNGLVGVFITVGIAWILAYALLGSAGFWEPLP